MAEKHPHWHDDIVKLLTGVRGAVEATSTEQFFLWLENDYRRKAGESHYKWADGVIQGLLIEIGEFGGMPVTVCMYVKNINDARILFYDSPSRVTDSRMVDEWIRFYLPETAKNQRRGQLNMTDAMNFCNVMHGIRDQDVYNSENKQENAHTG